MFGRKLELEEYVMEESMRLAAIVQMLQLHPRPFSKHAVHHHHLERVDE